MHSKLPLLFAIGLCACAPVTETDLSRVGEPRILAIQSQPAEADEGAIVTLKALVASNSDDTPDAHFALCVARKNLAELGPVAPECLSEGDASALVEATSGPPPSVVVDKEACSLFGPRRPDPKPGEPAGRPADADITGGYHQPIVAWLPHQEATLGSVRLHCGLTQADREQVEQYNRTWLANENPRIQSSKVRGTHGWQALIESQDEAARPPDAGVDATTESSETTADEIVSVQAGATVTFRGSFADCAQATEADAGTNSDPVPPPVGCTGSENYLLFDHETRLLETRSEQLVVSWYATDGRFAAYRTNETSLHTTENEWTAPTNPGRVRLWFVTRDGRGGVGFSRYVLDVK